MTYDEAKDWIFENLPEYVPPPPEEKFAKLILPLIRNMPACDLAQIIAVQPMQVPAGQVFYLDFVHGKLPWWKRLWKKIYATVAQLVEHATENRGVARANRARGTI